MKILKLSIRSYYFLFFISLVGFASDEFVNYRAVELPLTFKYPLNWGYNILDDFTYYPNKCYLNIPAGSDYRIHFSNVKNIYHCNILIYFIKYDSTHIYRITCYEGATDSTDLTELKKEIEKNYDLLLDNRKVQIYESFFEPSQALERYYRFFLKEYMIEIKVMTYPALYKPNKLYIEKGINYLIETNKDNKKLINFFDDLNVFLKSITIIE